MSISSTIAVAGLVALSVAGFTVPALAQNVCINRPAISLTDTTTDDAEALQRLDSLGNRCVRARASGRQVTRNNIISFLESNPGAGDVDYGEADQFEVYN